MLSSLLGDLAEAGITLRPAGGGRLEVTAPKDALTADLRERIAQYKPELLGWLVDTSGGVHHPDGTALTPDPAGWDLPFPPSDLQISYLIGSRQGLEYYVRPHQYLEWERDGLDPARFQHALNTALRARRASIVVLREDMQLQAVRDPEPVPVGVSDVRHLSQEAAYRHVERIRDQMQHRELPLDRWPWLDVHITLLPSGLGRLHYNHNNFFIDGPGTSGLLAQVWRCYEHPEEPLPELEVSYRDCVRALAALEESPRGEAARRYWTERLAHFPGPPDIPLAAGADSRDRSRMSRRDFVVPAQVWAALKQQAARYGLTPTTAVGGAYAELISYWSGSRHFLLNNMISHRMPLHPQMREVMGNFASLYPLEVDWRAGEPFHRRVHRLSTRIMADLTHTAWSGTKVLQALNQVKGSPGRAACPFVIGSGLFMGHLDRPAFSRLETPQVLLDCQFWEQRDGSLWLVWDVIEAMFPDGLIDSMQAAFRTLLHRLAQDAAAWDVESFDLLPDDQRAQRVQLNRSETPISTGLLHRRLGAHPRQYPDRPYVVAEDRIVTYAVAHHLSTGLAGVLRGHGVGVGDLVAVVLPKGWRQVVAVLATLTAGAGYVPIDPDWPDDRIRYLLGHTAAAAVVASEDLAGRIGGLGCAAVVCADWGTGTEPAAPEQVTLDADAVAYVIYTSGSTGRPKGVVLDHRGPLNTVVDINRRFGIGADDVIFGVSSLCFDLSVYDIFGVLEAGATLVLPGPDQTDPATWLRLLERHAVTVWNSVPALMELVIAEAAATGVRLPSLRTVLLSGDWIPLPLPQRIREIAPNARVISLGGATEASIWSICYPVQRSDPRWTSIPYGRPLANQTWHVLDERGRDAPTWTGGDLYIGGAGVAKGYLNDPQRSAAAFALHPRTGERLYRTGDRGRYLSGGDIEFLGRADFQVKIQGFRVEPGEVEQVLCEHPAVGQAVVVARATPAGRQLAAFVVCGAESPAPAADDLSAFLEQRLPAYLVPSYLTVIDRMPLTANGKVDRSALESLHLSGRSDRGYVAPRTPTERVLVSAWEEILSVTRIGVEDDFFALGGQSFAALRLTGLVRDRLGRTVPIGALLESRTVARLAQRLDAESVRWSPLLCLRDGPNARPWFLVHPAGGDPLCYRELAELTEAPCYAFQAPGPEAGRTPPRDVVELAREYLPALRAVRPHGPYVLGGWSSGGAIAVELAYQLEAGGEVVDQVVVLDAPAPVAPRDVDEVTLLLWFLENLDIGFDPRGVTDEERRKLAAAPDEGAALALGLACGGRHAGVDPQGLVSTFRVFRSIVHACNRYRAPRITAGITLVRASEGTVAEFGEHRYAGSVDWGWSSVTSGRVDVLAAPGTHHTMLRSPHVATVAAALRDQVRHG